VLLLPSDGGPARLACAEGPGRGDFSVLRDFRKHGEKAIAEVRRTQPAAYLKILALLVPREHKVERSNVIKELTDEELEAMIEYIEASLEAQAQSAKLIEGEAVPSLPSPVSAKNS
jgi:2-oxoglutarate dehydrogenase complex dehydrogenase (E1) component-like enzyme